LLLLLDILLFNFQFHSFALDVESQAVVNAHIDIRNPYQREDREQVAAPIRIEQFEPREDQEKNCHVVTEAKLAGKEIEEFSLQNVASILASSLTILARLTEYLLMRDCPRD